jgi:hypothetical protein
MKISKMFINPEIAKKLLLKVRNRQVYPRHVDYLSELMKNGSWKQNGETIKFDKNGFLIDGQHRLLAIIKANCSYEIGVVENLEDEALMYIDVGQKNRWVKTYFEIQKVLNSTSISAIISSYLCFINNENTAPTNRRKSSAIFTIEYIWNEYNKRPEYWQDVFRLASATYIATGKVLSRTLIGSFMAYFADFDNDKSLEFWNDFKREICQNNIIQILKTTLYKNNIAKRKYNSNYIKAITIKTWNYFRSNQNVKFLKWQETEIMPTPI